MGPLTSVSYIAGNLGKRYSLSKQRERAWVFVTLLLDKLGEINGRAVQPGRGSSLHPPHIEAEG